MIGSPGQWPRKNGSLTLTFLIATTRRPGIELEHPVDQQERVAVRQEAHDPGDVEHAVFPERAGRSARSAFDRRLLEQPPRQGVVGLVSRPVGDDEPVEVEAQESEVADHVEDLVPHALVGIAQHVADDAVAAEDQEVGRRSSERRCRRRGGRRLRTPAGRCGWPPARRGTTRATSPDRSSGRRSAHLGRSRGDRRASARPAAPGMGRQDGVPLAHADRAVRAPGPGASGPARRSRR